MTALSCRHITIMCRRRNRIPPAPEKALVALPAEADLRLRPAPDLLFLRANAATHGMRARILGRYNHVDQDLRRLRAGLPPSPLSPRPAVPRHAGRFVF